MKLSQYVTQQASNGKHCFTMADVRSINPVISDAALWASLRLLVKKEEICSPIRGFYLIIPPEYRSLGCLPPEFFIPNLMHYLQQTYYVCLLSAAQFYGAVHQQPQVFQVMVEKYRPNIKCGRVTIQFVTKATLIETPLNSFNTPKGVIKVATPEAVALDLVTYPHQSGGLSHVATLLAELVEQLDSSKLVALVNTREKVRMIQRMGYLFDEIIEEATFAEALWQGVHIRFERIVPLSAKPSTNSALKSKRWKIAINIDVESDL